MSRPEFEGPIFDLNVVGPIQTRFSFNGTGTVKPAQPIPVINFDLVSSGIFNDKNVEDLSPEFETARKILKIVAELGELGCRIRDGEFADMADNFGYTGKRVHALKTEISELVAPSSENEDPSPKTDFLAALRETRLIKRMVNKPPKNGKPFV